MCAVHDRPNDRTWREPDTMGRRTYIHARIRRTDCPSCGVRQVRILWARPGSHFMLQMESFMISMVRQMPVSTLAGMMHELAPKVWRVVRAYADRLVERLNISEADLALSERMCRDNEVLGATFRPKESLCQVCEMDDACMAADHPTDWIGWGSVTKCRNFMTLADTVERNIAHSLRRLTSGSATPSWRGPTAS